MKNNLKLLSLILCLGLCLGLNGFTLVNAQENVNEIFTGNEIKNISLTYNVSEDYVRKYTTLDNVQEKTKILNSMPAIYTKEEVENGSIISSQKTVYLDNDGKLPIIISSFQYDYNNELREGTDNVYYKSSYKLLANTWTQHIRYTREMVHFNYFRANVYDVYGTMSGGGICSQSSNFAKGMQNNPWARTIFSIQGKGVLQKDLVAYSSYNTYDVWSTTWS